MSGTSRPSRPRTSRRAPSEEPRLSVAVSIEAGERTAEWEAIWQELLLKPRTSSNKTPHVASPCAPMPAPPPPPPSVPAPKEGSDVA